jgi:hypothetical protein
MNPHIHPAIIETTGTTVKVTPLAIDPTDNTLPQIVNALGGDKAFEDIPELDLGNRNGVTGYIDFLEPTDLSAPMMRGTDEHGRPFVALRLERTRPRSRGRAARSSVKVETIFRRYVTGKTWTSGGASWIAGGALSWQDIDSIRRLAAGKLVGCRENRGYEVGDADGEKEAADMSADPHHHHFRKGEVTSYGRQLYSYEVGSLRLV